MIMTINELIEKILKIGGSLDNYFTIVNTNDKSLEFFPIDFEIEDDEIKIIIDCWQIKQ